MKPLSIIALVLGVAAMGVGVYHLVETYPNVKAFAADADKGRLYWRLWRSYVDAGFLQIYAMWALGGLGLILGGVSAAKAKEKFRIIAIAGLALSVIALIISLSTQMASRLG